GGGRGREAGGGGEGGAVRPQEAQPVAEGDPGEEARADRLEESLTPGHLGCCLGSPMRCRSLVPWCTIRASGRSAAPRRIGPEPTTGMVPYAGARGSVRAAARLLAIDRSPRATCSQHAGSRILAHRGSSRGCPIAVGGRKG